jgi:hypothetical protein
MLCGDSSCTEHVAQHLNIIMSKRQTIMQAIWDGLRLDLDNVACLDGELERHVKVTILQALGRSYTTTLPSKRRRRMM